jgi:hypothetical protein
MKDGSASKVTVEKIPDVLWSQIQNFGQPKIPMQARGSRSQMPVPGANPSQQLPYNSQTGAYGYYPPPPAGPVIIMQPRPWGAPIQVADGSWYPYQPAAQPPVNLSSVQQ